MSPDADDRREPSASRERLAPAACPGCGASLPEDGRTVIRRGKVVVLTLFVWGAGGAVAVALDSGGTVRWVAGAVAVLLALAFFVGVLGGWEHETVGCASCGTTHRRARPYPRPITRRLTGHGERRGRARRRSDGGR